MPKDATKNVDRYKVRGGQLNEYEFHQNQEQTAAEKKTKKGAPMKAEGAGAKSANAKGKTANVKGNSGSVQGKSAKKLAAGKASKKK